ncbi:MAG: response regulator transcription factor [Hydrogenimonas sp.]|nr:response regulator transcription factor [Hydrogenimonas sp.]
MSKILLMEDDETLGETLKDLLENDGFKVVWVKSGEEALDESFKSRFDLFLLDVKVPDIDGFELLSSLRSSGDETPTIFITALTDIDSLSKGFESGADDYIKKPFDFDELLVRINALIHKRYGTSSSVLEYGNIKYDIKSENITKDGEPIHIPPFEKRLLKLFLQRRGEVLSKEDISYELANGESVSDQALRVHVNKLRKAGFIIANLRGIGYRLEDPE